MLSQCTEKTKADNLQWKKFQVLLVTDFAVFICRRRWDFMLRSRAVKERSSRIRMAWIGVCLHDSRQSTQHRSSARWCYIQKCFNQFIFLFDSSRSPYSRLEVCVSSGFQVFRLLLSFSAVDGSAETFGWVDDRNQSITNLTNWELILEFSRCYKNVCVFFSLCFSLFFYSALKASTQSLWKFVIIEF